jgi:hypothetical protein
MLRKKPNDKKKIASRREYGGDNDNLIYESGIPTLWSSAHRVKFDVKRRKETKTTWLPPQLIEDYVFPYDVIQYDLKGAILSLLQNCDPDIVGTFEDNTTAEGSSSKRLEDFRVPVLSVWRSVNGGCCEDAQKYLSDRVAADEAFLDQHGTVKVSYFSRAGGVGRVQTVFVARNETNCSF